MGAVEITDPSPRDGARSQFTFRVLHLTTPEWLPAVQLGYGEHKDILNHVQQTLSRDPRGADYPEVLFMADQAAVRARRVLQGWLERE